MPWPNPDLALLSKSEHARKIFEYLEKNTDETWLNRIIQRLGYPKATVVRYLRLMKQANILQVNRTRLILPEKYLMNGKKVSRLSTKWVNPYEISETPEAVEFKRLLCRQS